MKVLVCGGSGKLTAPEIMAWLEKINVNGMIKEVITCGESDTEKHAIAWAKLSNIAYRTFVPDILSSEANHGFTHYIRAIQEGEPDRGIAFPGNQGTDKMIRGLRSQGIPVMVIAH